MVALILPPIFRATRPSGGRGADRRDDRTHAGRGRADAAGWRVRRPDPDRGTDRGPAAPKELESARRLEPRRSNRRAGGTPRRAGFEFDPGVTAGDHGPGDRIGPGWADAIGRR